MLDTILTVATGGASGLLGSVIGKAFSIFDNMQQEKKSQRDHERTMEMHRLDAELRTEERENELAIADTAKIAYVNALKRELEAPAIENADDKGKSKKKESE